MIRLIGLSLFLLLTACHEKPQQKTALKTYPVQLESNQKTLYFSGNIQPLHETTLTSLVDAVVESMPTHFGAQVKKGDVLFVLNSQELQRQYQDSLTNYLKAKDSYTVARTKFEGTQTLWKSGLVSNNNFLSEKSGLYTARVSMLQAKHKLADMLEKLGDPSDLNPQSLSYDEFDKVRVALSAKNSFIYIKAPADGVLLYPPKSADEKSNQARVGAQVKAGQVLGLIGDLSGLIVEIDIPEVDIDKIKPGMPVAVRGTAFPKETLHGILSSINAQASNQAGGGFPSFKATVEVSALDEAQREWVKVGLSATVELAVNSGKSLFIPIAAVKEAHEKRMVLVQSDTGEITPRVVITGAAEVDKVVIDSGLSPGDVVVYE